MERGQHTHTPTLSDGSLTSSLMLRWRELKFSGPKSTMASLNAHRVCIKSLSGPPSTSTLVLKPSMRGECTAQPPSRWKKRRSAWKLTIMEKEPCTAT